MATVEVTFEYKGDDTIPGLRLRKPEGEFVRLRLSGGKASYEIPENETWKIFWLVVGTPGAKYSISLKAPSGHRIDAPRNPIESEVPSEGLGYGRMLFKAAKKK